MVVHKYLGFFLFFALSSSYYDIWFVVGLFQNVVFRLFVWERLKSKKCIRSIEDITLWSSAC